MVMKNSPQTVEWSERKWNSSEPLCFVCIRDVTHRRVVGRSVNTFECDDRRCASHDASGKSSARIVQLWAHPKAYMWVISRMSVQSLCNRSSSTCNARSSLKFINSIMNCSRQCFVSTSQFFVRCDKFQVAVDVRNRIPRLWCRASSSVRCPTPKVVPRWKQII